MARTSERTESSRHREMLIELAAGWGSVGVISRAPPRSDEAAEALERMNEGNYGVCESCCRRIPAARLRIKPEAKRCVPCQQIHERRSVAWSDQD